MTTLSFSPSILTRLRGAYFLRKPWMAPEEIALIERHLGPDTTMLEWGSGGSTAYFSKRVKRYHAIEHDPKWAAIVRAHVGDSVDVRCVPPDAATWKRPTRYEDFARYVDAVDTIGVPRFDVVLIDGRARPECASKVLPYVDERSIVFVHDFFMKGREYYAKVFAWYEEIASVRHTRQTLVALRKKRAT